MLENNTEFDHIITKLQTALKLCVQYENHTYVEEFTKECNVVFIYRIYILEGEKGASFFLSVA